MDASCKIQGSIHVFRLVNNMCPGKWVHIKILVVLLFLKEADIRKYEYQPLSRLYILSWYSIGEPTEDFIRNGGRKRCNFKS